VKDPVRRWMKENQMNGLEYDDRPLTRLLLLLPLPLEKVDRLASFQLPVPYPPRCRGEECSEKKRDIWRGGEGSNGVHCRRQRRTLCLNKSSRGGRKGGEERDFVSRSWSVNSLPRRPCRTKGLARCTLSNLHSMRGTVLLRKNFLGLVLKYRDKGFIEIRILRKIHLVRKVVGI